MPWTARDADRHKKGLSAKQKRMWAAVANSVLAACLKDGGTDATCAPKAIRGANSTVGEPQAMQRLVTQAALTAPTTTRTVHDCAYVVAPGVLIVEGVLNGGLIPASALVADDWDYIPITLTHPRDAQGQPISAQDAAVLEQYSVGHLAHCRLGQGQRNGQVVCSLQADLYLDEARIAQVWGSAATTLARIQAQEPCELSTGFFSTSLPAQGQFAGTPYTEIHQTLMPDHLALLPDEVGACGWGDGCGTPRLHHAACTCADPAACTCHAEEPLPMDDVTPPLSRMQRLWQAVQAIFHEEHAAVVVEEVPHIQQTDADLRDALQGCLMRDAGDQEMPAWIDTIDAQNQYFTYHQGGEHYRRYWSTQDGVVTLMDGAEPVQQVTEYVPIPSQEALASNTTEDPPMAHVVSTIVKKHVDWLIANSAETTWTEEDRHHLEAMTEPQLMRLRSLPRQVPLRASDSLTVEDALATLPPELRESHLASHRDYERRKAALIVQVMAHKHNPYSEGELRNKNVEFLTSLLAMAGEETPEPAHYGGRAMPQVRVVQNDDDQPPPLPNTLDLVVQRQRELGLRH